MYLWCFSCCRVVFRCGLVWNWESIRVGRVTHLIVGYDDWTNGTQVSATPTVQSVVGAPATNVRTESGDAETAVSTSDGNSHQSRRFASWQDDVRCPLLADKSVQDERLQRWWESMAGFRQAAGNLDWAKDGYDQPISESVIQQVGEKENWVDMAKFNMQLHGDLVSLMEERSVGFEIVRNTKTEVGLDAWRRLNHKYDRRNPLRNIQLLECCSRRRKLSIQTWLQAWRYSSKWFARDLASMCRTSGNGCTWCASRRFVRRSSVLTLLTPLRNREGRSKNSSKRTCMGQERRPWMSMPLPRPGRQERRQGERQGRQVEEDWRWLFLVWRVWSHDGILQKEAAGTWEVPKSPRGPGPKPKGKGKGGQGKKGAAPLDERPDGQEAQPSDEKAIEEVVFLFVDVVSRHARYSQWDWQACERIQKQTRDQWKSYKNGNLCVNAVDAELRERERESIWRLTLVVLPVLPVFRQWVLHPQLGCKSWTKLLKSTPLQTLKRFESLDSRFLHSSFRIVTCEIWRSVSWTNCPNLWWRRVRLWQRASAKNQGGSFIEEVRSKQETNLWRDRVYVLPCWVVKQNSQKRLAPWSSRSETNGRFIRKPNHPFWNKPGCERRGSGPLRADEIGLIRV